MIVSQAESLISEYAASEHFMFLAPRLKEQAESLLTAFFREARAAGAADLESLTAKTVGSVLLDRMPRLDAPVEVKRAVPDLLEGFFGFLHVTGRFPPAGAWEICVGAHRQKYRDGLRGDGSAKGETFKKRYTDVGRNDPCPCGSGAKFKKCCMPLIQ